jgi:hypothetical protein
MGQAQYQGPVQVEVQFQALTVLVSSGWGCRRRSEALWQGAQTALSSAG